MTRISVHLPDPVADGLRALAGTDASVSATAASLLEQALRERAHQAIGAYEAARDDPEWEAQRVAHGLT